MTEDAMPSLPRIGEPAPPFEADSTHGTIRFPDDYDGRWVVLFSHPGDFTPVCTTEFLAFAAAHDRFRALRCELLGLSVDSTFSHIAWLRTIEERIEHKGRTGVRIEFPVISDTTMDIAFAYGMLQPADTATQTVRAVFVVDPGGTVRAVIYYPMQVGRSIPEILRLLQALQRADNHAVSTPADWQPGEDVLLPPPGSCGSARNRTRDTAEGERCLDWFFTLAPDPDPDPGADA